MRAAFLVLALFLAACSDMQMTSGAPAAGEAPIGALQAYFDEYPDRLFEVAALLCDDPGQTSVVPNVNEVRCESLPDTESAAALILQFDGTVEELPTYVISFKGRSTSEGYLVTADTYIRVPQRTGGALQIRLESAETREDLAMLLDAVPKTGALPGCATPRTDASPKACSPP